MFTPYLLTGVTPYHAQTILNSTRPWALTSCEQVGISSKWGGGEGLNINGPYNVLTYVLTYANRMALHASQSESLHFVPSLSLALHTN